MSGLRLLDTSNTLSSQVLEQQSKSGALSSRLWFLQVRGQALPSRSQSRKSTQLPDWLDGHITACSKLGSKSNTAQVTEGIMTPNTVLWWQSEPPVWPSGATVAGWLLGMQQELRHGLCVRPCFHALSYLGLLHVFACIQSSCVCVLLAIVAI